VFDQVEADGLIVAFCHFPDPFGKLVRAEGKRIFQAVQTAGFNPPGPLTSRDAVPGAKMRPRARRSAAH